MNDDRKQLEKDLLAANLKALQASVQRVKDYPEMEKTWPPKWECYPTRLVPEITKQLGLGDEPITLENILDKLPERVRQPLLAILNTDIIGDKYE